MSCCSGKRAALTSQHRDAAAADGRSSSGLSGLATRIQYLGRSPVAVSGPVSGRQYQFSERQPTQLVDMRDVPALLQVGIFRAAS